MVKELVHSVMKSVTMVKFLASLMIEQAVHGAAEEVAALFV